MTDLLQCPECEATDFLQIQHGYVYWSATITPDGSVDTDLDPYEFGDADTIGYECLMCRAAFDSVEGITR